MHPQNPSNSIRKFFAGLAEYTFQTRLGVADPQLVDYVSDMLTRFVRNDAMYRVRNGKGKPVLQVAEMLMEAQQRVGEAKRDVHRHIGDFTLFWTGLYPESVDKSRKLGMDMLLDYREQGKRAYWIASKIESSSQNDAPSEILQRLSDGFELCAYGLREIRNEWERSDDGDAPKPFLLN